MKKILVLGSRGLVGSALVKEFARNFKGEILKPLREELDLFKSDQVQDYFEKYKPCAVVMAAAKVGGIHANNTFRADFLYENLVIQNNVIWSAHKSGVEKFLFLGSSCIYPKNCPQPIKEEYLLTGALEATNEPYALAKIAGLKLVENIRRQFSKPGFFSVMPTNLYGENDNYHPENSHVIPGLIRRMSEAKKNNDKVFKVWGSGNPMREFLHADDLARACWFLLNYDKELPYWINVGYGEDVSIRDLAYLIKDAVGLKANIEFDSNMPDGTMKKLLDSSLIQNMGWKPRIPLNNGLKLVIGNTFL